jgi:hypothetical protein
VNWKINLIPFYSPRHLAFALLCVVALAAPLHAAERPGAAGYPDTPEGVVRAYCEADFRSLANSSVDHRKWMMAVSPYVAFHTEVYPAVYAALVTQHTVGKSTKITEGRFRVDVTYEVVAYEQDSVEGSPFVLTYPITEVVPFIVRKASSGWKIDYPRGLLPHVSVEERIKYHRIGGRALANILEEHLKEIGQSGR